jgi:hypothetical protein
MWVYFADIAVSAQGVVLQDPIRPNWREFSWRLAIVCRSINFTLVRDELGGTADYHVATKSKTTDPVVDRRVTAALPNPTQPRF